MTPADLQLPERGSAPVEDPAVVAGKEAKEAEAAFNAVPGSTPAEEDTPLFKAAQERMEAADAAFADAPITSTAGALTKMRAIVDIGSGTLDGPHLETRHFKTVFMFLEAVAGGKAAPIGDHPDAELIARVVEFYRAFEKHNIAGEAWGTRRAEVDAMPDCPPIVAPVFDKAGNDRWNAFMKAKGIDKLSDKANTAARAMGKAANRVFAIPAHTYLGAVEKVKIANLATGDGEGVGNADDDLDSYQDFDNPWMKKAIADLERLVGAPSVVADDPAVVAFAELTAAWTAFDGLGDEEPGHGIKGDPRHAAAYRRFADARDAAFSVVPVSVAGVAAKVRAMLKHQSEAYELGPDFNIMAKSMLPFLEGAPAPAPKPDPVVVLFAKWGALQDEAIALEKADPESDDPAIEDQRAKLYLRQNGIEDQIIATAATSVGGIAVKLRFMAHAQYPLKGLVDLYATPAKDPDFKGFIEAYREDTGLSMDDNLLLGALCDAERLAGS